MLSMLVWVVWLLIIVSSWMIGIGVVFVCSISSVLNIVSCRKLSLLVVVLIDWWVWVWVVSVVMLLGGGWVRLGCSFNSWVSCLLGKVVS